MAFNKNKSMWILVLFDLPFLTKENKKSYGTFRKKLLQNGFNQFQFSIYIRFCASNEIRNIHIGRIKKILPSSGKISILQITDNQYSNIINMWGKSKIDLKPAPTQLTLF